MAGQFFKVVTPAIALSAATGMTAAQLVAAANHAAVIWGYEVSFNGVSNTDEPALVEGVRQSDAGTMTGLTPQKSNDSNGDTLDSTAQHTATVEPTGSTVVLREHVHPQTGVTKFFNDKTKIDVGAGDRLGIKITAPDAVDVVVTLHCEE